MPTSELGTAILPAKGECIPSCVIHIDLLTHIPLVPGEPHILEIVPAISGMSWFFANAFNPYPGGDVIVNNFPQPSVDLIFATLFLQPGEVDTTPPEITASLEPICGEDDEGLFTVQFSATDDSGVESITATLNGITVTNGQTVKLELDDDLVVTASDSKGNSDTLSVIPSFSDLQVCKDEEDDNDEMGGDGSDSGGSGSDSGGSGSDSGGSGSGSGGSGSGNDSQDDFSEGSDGSN